MSNEIDSSMKLLPYVDDKFVGYRNKSVQDFRFALSEGIRSQVFFATFVEKVENQIKSISVINASNCFYIVVVMQVLNLKIIFTNNYFSIC